MRILKSIAAAAAFAVVGLAAAPAAMAQAAASTPVVVVNLDRIYVESLAGRDAQAKLKGIAQAVTKELEPESKSLQAEQTQLGPRFKDKTQEQVVEELRKDPALNTRFNTYLQRLDAHLGKQQLRRQELAATEEKAVRDVLSAAGPMINESMAARGASVVLSAGSIVTGAASVDITPDVIARLNARVKTVEVSKIDLAQRPQAATAPPAPAQPAAPAPRR